MSFGTSDYKKARERFLQRKNQVGAEGWIRFDEGKHRLRILPPPANQDNAKFRQDYFYVEYGVHYGIGSEESNETITCPKVTLKRPCPICEFTKGLWKRGTPADQQLARRIGVKTRCAANIVVLSKPSDHKMWSFGKNVRDQIEELCFSGEEPIAIDHPDTGYNFVLNVTHRSTPDGVFPQYMITPEMKPCPLPDKKVLDKVTNLAEMLCSKVRSYDEIRSILLGSGHEKPSAQAPATSVPEEVVEEGVEEGADEVVEEDVNPPRTAAEAAMLKASTATASAPAPVSSADIIKRAKQAMQSRKLS